MFIHRKKYDLIVGDNSTHIFKTFYVDELCGLSYKEAKQYNETNEDVYIAGLCNYHNNRLFVFINRARFNGTYTDTSLVFHEMMHCSFAIHDSSHSEEQKITWAENETNWLMKYLQTKYEH